MKRLSYLALAVVASMAVIGGILFAARTVVGRTQSNPATDSGKLAEQHFEKAVKLLKQENFQDAVALYEEVIKLSPQTQIAQDAQYWIGQTYYRMGKYDEALLIFKKLLKEYPGSAIVPVTQLMLSRVQQEKENVKQRAKRDDALDKKVIVDPKTGAEFRKIKVLTGKSDVIDYVMSGVFLSPNGKFLLNHKTAIPLDGQEPFDLVDKPALRSIWSPDGKKVAFFLEDAIWVIPVSPETARPTGPAKKLLDGRYRFENPVSWSPDSEKIVFTKRDEKTQGDIWTLSINDGALIQITDDEAPEHGASWSPDGKTITYVKGSETWAVAVDGGKPRKLIDRPGLVFWSPDGRYLVLMTKVYRPNLFRLADQRLFAIEPPEGIGQFLSWSSDSKKLLFYRSSYDYSINLRVVSSNGGPTFELGRDLKLWPYFHDWSPDSQWVITAGQDRPLWMIPLAGGEAVPIEVDRHDHARRRDAPMDKLTEGQFNMGSLSPDCKRLLFSLDRDDGKEDLYVALFSLEEARTTGPPVEILKGWERHRGLRDYSWSSDSQGVSLIHKGNIWVTSVDKPKLVQVTDSAEVEKLPVWAPHGEMIAHIAETKKGDNFLRTVPVSGGEPRTILDPCYHYRYAWSPDGKKLVAESKRVISVMTFPEGESRQVVNLGREGLEGALGFCWLPDGKRFAFIGQKGREAPTRIYVVPAEGGKIAELAADDDNWKDWLFSSPDGKWISYDSEGTVKTRPEGSIWEVNVEDLLKEKK
jgi:Tol biopolymer transport system component